MTEAEFRAKRRQKFLTLRYFKLNETNHRFNIQEDSKAIANNVVPVTDVDHASVPGSAFKTSLKLLNLHYTAGDPIESLRLRYAEAMKWFEEWHRAYRAYIQSLAKDSSEELRTDGTPVYFEDLHHFQLAIDMVSLGILLGEADAVRRISTWLSRYRHTDMMLETLLEKVITDPDTEVSTFHHEEPYGLLLDAVHTAETPEEASAYVKRYLEGWYKAFDGVPWHDGHLQVTDEYSNYEGYWSFEAAAVCVLYGIDDSTFRDHIVYPKDLADWAREHRVMDLLAAAASAQSLRLRCEGGQPCPRAGYWSTPASPNSRRRFNASEVMPVIERSAWGATIWYWDESQG